MATLPDTVTQMPDPMQALQQSNKKIADTQAEGTAAEAAIRGREQAATAPVQERRTQAGQDVSGMLAKGPEQVPLPKNEAMHIDPKQMSDMAGLMMALAGLAGSMTRSPLTASLRGMTGAMQGVKAADEQQFNRGYQEYKDNLNAAIKTNDEKLKEYDRVLKGKEFNLREMDAELTRIAKQYGDEVTLNAKSYKDRIEAITSQRTATQKIIEHKDAMDMEAKKLNQQWAMHKEKAAGAPGGGGTPDGIRAETYAFLINGISPPKRGTQYQTVMEDIAALAKENHMSTEQLLSSSADVKSRLMAKRSFEIRAQNMTRAENQLKLEIPILEDAMKKIAPPDSPLFANLDLKMIRNGGGTKEQRAAVTQMDQAAETVFNEFEGIVTGNPGALNVSDVAKAKENYHNAQAPTEMKSAIEGMKRIIHNAKKSVDVTRGDIMGGVTGAIDGNKGADHPGTNAKGWALHRNKKTGEQAYIGPNGEIEKVQ